MWNQKPSFRFEIENFSEKKAVISSQTFVSGGCEWNVLIYPEGVRLSDGHLPLYINANSTKLRTGWKRSIKFYFVLLNQSHKELHISPIVGEGNLFCASKPAWGIAKTLPVSKFQEKGFLENDRLIIEVYIKVIEAFDGEGGDVSNNKKKTVDINGFQVFASQVTKVGKIFTEHPDIAKDFKPTNQEVKTAYMNVLLRVIKTLHKPPKSLSETRLSKASSELSELMDVGFKLDWLKSKLEEVYLERKKPDVDGSKVQQLEEHVKELGLKLDSLNAKLGEVSLERKKENDTNESRGKQVEKRVNNLGMMELELRLKLDSLNAKLDVVSLERKKADDTIESRAKQVEKRVKDLALMDLGFNKRLNTMLGDWEMKKSHETSVFASRIEQMEEHVMGLGFKLDSLNTKLEEISKERKKTAGCLVQKHEESVKNIEIMVSHLKAELDKKKDKTSDDGFLLVD